MVPGPGLPAEDGPTVNDPPSGEHSPIEQAKPVERGTSSFDVGESIPEETVTSPASVEDEAHEAN